MYYFPGRRERMLRTCQVSDVAFFYSIPPWLLFYLRNCSSCQPYRRDGNCRFQYRIDRLVSFPVTKIPRRERHRQNRRVLHPPCTRFGRVWGGGILMAVFRPTQHKNQCTQDGDVLQRYGGIFSRRTCVPGAAKTTVTGENTARARVVVVTYLRQCQSVRSLSAPSGPFRSTAARSTHTRRYIHTYWRYAVVTSGS